MHSRNQKRRKPPNRFISTAEEKPKNYVFVYSDNRAIAGFCFERYEGKTRPIKSFRLNSIRAGELVTELEKINTEHPIELVFVPPNKKEDSSRNVLLECVPDDYEKQAAPEALSFEDCLRSRLVAISKGALVEEGYPETPRILSAIQHAENDATADIWLWSYVYGAATIALYSPPKPSDYWAPNTQPPQPY